MKYVVLVDGRSIEVEIDGDRVTAAGRTHQASLGVIPGTPLRQLLLDDEPSTMSVTPLGRGRWALTQHGERVELEVLDERAHHIRGLPGAADQRRVAPVLKAPMPGLVVRVQVQPGAQVSPGDGLVVLEAMKMENELKAQSAGVVKRVRVAAGEAVEKGQVLVEFEDHSPP
ncbi:MAG: acetyl-CoA carboxylase biotin carboxyl carrier protein subunit [Gemmatimonadales bacterium]